MSTKTEHPLLYGCGNDDADELPGLIIEGEELVSWHEGCPKPVDIVSIKRRDGRPTLEIRTPSGMIVTYGIDYVTQRPYPLLFPGNRNDPQKR